jgi:hypothetical protein
MVTLLKSLGRMISSERFGIQRLDFVTLAQNACLYGCTAGTIPRKVTSLRNEWMGQIVGRNCSLRKLIIIALVASVFLSFAQSKNAQSPTFDLVLKERRIVDGSGSPWYRGDLAIRGDAIVKIAASITESRRSRHRCRGAGDRPRLYRHSHPRAERYFQVPTAENYVRQGVTTLIEGPDGSSPVPLKPFFDRLEALPKSVNIGSFIGQGAVRAAVIGNANRQPTAEELEKMRALVEQGMKEGAFGLSSGLFYVPVPLRLLTRSSNWRELQAGSEESTSRTCATKRREFWRASTRR